MKILGISSFYHDSAAALIVDGEIVAAAQEERFSRKKFDPGFPEQSIRFCLKKANLKISDIDEIVYYEKPLLSFERLLESILETAPKSFMTFLSAMPIWVREKLNTRQTLINKFKFAFPQEKIPAIAFSKHHLSHAASAFYPSPFENAAVMCLDGVGEWATASAWQGSGNQLKPLWEMHFPHSLGLLYSAFTYFCGFKVNSGEYKLMGLAPYGKPLYVDLIKRHLIDIKPDGSFRLNMKYFSFASSLSMTNAEFAKLFGAPVRDPEGPMQEIYKDMAASIQKVTEEVLLLLAKTLKSHTGDRNLCLAGGVALNCVANGFLSQHKIFDRIWVQPAAGDSGGALGAALASYYLQHNQSRKVESSDSMKCALLGPSFTDADIEEILQRHSISYRRLTDQERTQKALEDLLQQKVVGWFDGAMEYGPRALGSRSILGDPRDPTMQSRMNLKIKFRESFRPFAPLILEPKISEIFQDNFADPYMLFVSQAHPHLKDAYPAVIHVDGSARVQRVPESSRPISILLQEFYKSTQCPMLINTSFNVRGEPIVCTPFDALRCFVQTDIDSLFLGSFYISKLDQSFDRSHLTWRLHRELD